MKLSIILSQLSTGMAGTISIFVLTLVFSLPLGLLIAFGRMSKNRIVSGIFRLYISLMRGTPLMLQLMVVYFGPFYLFGMNIGKWRFPANYHRICFKLRRLFCRNLPLRASFRWIVDSTRQQSFLVIRRDRRLSALFCRRL